MSQQKKNQELWILPNLRPGVFHEKEATGNMLLTIQLQGNLEHPANQKTLEILKLKEKWPHNLHMSPTTVPHTDAVFSIVRKIYEREPADPMEDLDVNAANWGMFLSTTLQAAVHLGQDYEVNLQFVKNHLWNSVEQLINV